MKYCHILCLAILFLPACDSGSTTTSSSPVTTTTTTSVQPDPKIISSDVQINRSTANYHYIGWKFTIESPRAYDYGYVEIRWYDANNFQIEWSNWSGRILQGTHTYSDETMVRKDIWARVVRRDVVLLSWR